MTKNRAEYDNIQNDSKHKFRRESIFQLVCLGKVFNFENDQQNTDNKDQRCNSQAENLGGNRLSRDTDFAYKICDHQSQTGTNNF